MSKFKIPKATPPIILVGLTGSAVAVVFHHAINFIHHAIWHPLAHGTSESFILIGFIVLTLVGLANGWLLSHFAPEAAGSGIPQLKTAYRKNRGQISLRIVWVKFIAATLSVGGGLSLGREGPSVQLAGGLASVIGQKLKLSHFRIRTLTACGAAAGLAAAFNAPIAAVAFVLEEIIEDLNSRTIGPILLASFVSIVTLFFLQGTEPAFAIPPVESFNGWVYIAVPLVAALASLAGVGFQKSTLSWARKIRERSSLPSWSRPVVGAWINWAIACLVFYWVGRLGVLGLGHEDLTASLAGELTLISLIVLFIAKWFATSSAYAWGNCGGIFTPTLFLGAMIGGACGQGIDLGLGLDQDSQRLLTIVGMSACLGAVVRAPITSILIVFEMTHDFALVPPLMLAALVSQAISRSLCKENFYNQFLKDSGIHLETASSLRAQASWRNRRISAFANFDAPFLKSMDKDKVREKLNQYPDDLFPLLDADNQPSALIERTELDEFLGSNRKPRLHSPTLVYAEQTMQEIEDLLQKDPLSSLILVTRENRYLGLFSNQEAIRSKESENRMAES
ncbi:MAG: chloride channel protein [Opitutae bacterium]|nr:chloride channel protein [Opitutae bacterium]